MDLRNIKSIVIRSSYDNNNVMVIFDIMDNINENMFIDKLKSCVNSLYVKSNKTYRLIYGLEYIIDKIGDLSKEKKYVFKCPSCGEEFTRWYKN